jgi:hypothetical protein
VVAFPESCIGMTRLGVLGDDVELVKVLLSKVAVCGSEMREGMPCPHMIRHCKDCVHPPCGRLTMLFHVTTGSFCSR